MPTAVVLVVAGVAQREGGLDRRVVSDRHFAVQLNHFIPILFASAVITIQ